MSAKRLVTAVLLAFVAVSIAVLAVQEVRGVSPAAGQAGGSQIVVYYFHPTKRCANCRRIEAVARKALEDEFPAELRDGRVAWRVLNYEEPANKHFVDDYKITTSTVVAVEFRNGTPVRWKNLDALWEFIAVNELLADFVRQEVGSFVRGS